MVITGVVVPEPLLLLEDPPPPPHPAAVKAAAEIATTSKAPQRRRRGSVSNRALASVAPEVAAYHGGMPDDLRCAVTSSPLVVFALLWKAEMVSVVLTAPEESVTGFTENANWEATDVLAVAVKLIVPVKPLKGVRVRVTPEAVLPDLADAAA